MTGLEKYKEDRIKELKEMKLTKAVEEISLTVFKCKYCIHHKNKTCERIQYISSFTCRDGIREYLEKESN